MLSQKNKYLNEHVIPKLLREHAVSLSSDPDFVDLSTAENNLVKPELLNIINEPDSHPALTASDLSYPKGIGGSLPAREAVANLVNEHFTPKKTVDADTIVLGAGATYLLDALAAHICNPGDAFLVAAPYWPGFDISLSVHNDMKVIPVQLPLDEVFSTSSVQYYQQAYEASSEQIKAVLVCNPHNPLGRCYPKPVMAALAAFCHTHDLHLISDESYALSIHCRRSKRQKSPSFCSALSLDGHGRNLYVLYSLGKDFGCSGIRFGALIVQHNESVRLGVALSTHSQLSSLAASVTAKCILKNTQYIMEKNSVALRKACKKLETFLMRQRIQYIPASAGMFIFARLCPSEDEEAHQQLQVELSSNKVALAAGHSYHFSQPGWFRISYAMDPSLLDLGIHRLQTSLRAVASNETRCAQMPGQGKSRAVRKSQTRATRIGNK